PPLAYSNSVTPRELHSSIHAKGRTLSARPLSRSSLTHQSEVELFHQSVPPSCAYWSISASSAALNSRPFRAPSEFSSCATELAPISEEVTRGSRSVQAMAI